MCIFCEIIKGNIPSKKVYEDDDVLAILDISQLTCGHTLVMPKKHVANIYDCDEETLNRVMAVVRKLAGELTEKLQAGGCNIINNNNEVAGQSVPHLHFHIIPRYSDQDAVSTAFAPKGDKVDLDEVLARIKG